MVYWSIYLEKNWYLYLRMRKSKIYVSLEKICLCVYLFTIYLSYLNPSFPSKYPKQLFFFWIKYFVNFIWIRFVFPCLLLAQILSDVLYEAIPTIHRVHSMTTFLHSPPHKQDLAQRCSHAFMAVVRVGEFNIDIEEHLGGKKNKKISMEGKIFIYHYRIASMQLRPHKKSPVSGHRSASKSVGDIFFLGGGGWVIFFIFADQWNQTKFPIHKVWWLREASQIGQTLITLCEKVT